MPFCPVPFLYSYAYAAGRGNISKFGQTIFLSRKVPIRKIKKPLNEPFFPTFSEIGSESPPSFAIFPLVCFFHVVYTRA